MELSGRVHRLFTNKAKQSLTVSVNSVSWHSFVSITKYDKKKKLLNRSQQQNDRMEFRSGKSTT
jgi:hypothetical protein